MKAPAGAPALGVKGGASVHRLDPWLKAGGRTRHDTDRGAAAKG